MLNRIIARRFLIAALAFAVLAMAIPPRRIDASGFYLGLRTGFRF